MMLGEYKRRIAVMRQFELQYPKYPLEILERLTNFRYRIFEQEREMEMLATVLASSFDFYEHRLNLVKHGFRMIICQKHDAVVPLFVLELDTCMLAEPGGKPTLMRPVEERKRRTQDEQRVLISQILLSTEAGREELKEMPEPTRRRYLALRDEYLQPKVGRPWVS
jgi:hypothetical protein